MISQRTTTVLGACTGFILLLAGCHSRPKNVTTIPPAPERGWYEGGTPVLADGAFSSTAGSKPIILNAPPNLGRVSEAPVTFEYLFQRSSAGEAAGFQLGFPSDLKKLENFSTALGRNLRFTSGDGVLIEGEQRGEAAERVSPLAESIGDELWIIYRPEELQPASTNFPGSGCLLAKQEEREVPLPLAHTDVKASIEAYIATVNVTQQFENPFETKIEAVYVFPLPEESAVNEFLMVIGERRIRGIIREREEAEQIYEQAKAQGYTASLLTQERPNIFTQSVANIEPGKKIDISIKYYHTLAYDDGWYEFVFPMVVGPRFNPPGQTNGIGAVPVEAHHASGQATDVHYLRPGERSGHDIAVQVDLFPGVQIEEAECKTHPLLAQSPTSDWQELAALAHTPAPTLSVKLDPRDTIPNKDLVLRYRVAGDRIKSSLITHRDQRGGFFTLMLYPPSDLQHLQRAPLELVFVLDCSGSMNGAPMEQATAAIEYALKNLQPGDSFQLINFANEASQLGPAPLEATAENIRLGLDYLASLKSGGGTMMIHGTRAALDFPHDPNRLRFVCFLTDGFIGNEIEILEEVHRRLGESRIFTFGVGSSVNRFLLESMAKVGRGAVAYLGLEDDGAKVMQAFLDRISHPAMTDVEIDWGNLEPAEVYPKQIPDLFVGRPVVITGRFEGEADEPLVVYGKAAGKGVEARVAGSNETLNHPTQALPSIWARLKITDLLEQARYGAGEAPAADIRKLALDYQLMSPYTAFLALDASKRSPGEPTTVPVAVPLPEGVEYETTVGE